MKQILLILSILSITIHVNGQALKSIGVKCGMSVANQTWNYEPFDITLKRDYRNGFCGSVMMEFFESNYLSLVTDIGYCAKGNSDKVLNTTTDMPEGNGTYKKYDTKFNYIAISPMLKARFESIYFVPYVLLGLRMDYQLSYKSGFNYD